MTTLEWNETNDGYTSGGYQITRAGAKRWSMELDTSLIPPVVQRRSSEARMFRSLRSARAAALHLEAVRIRRIKLIRHVSLSIVLFGLSVGFYLTMSAGSETNGLEWFTLSAIALVLALSEGLDVFVLPVADGWDRRYDVPRISTVDRVVSHMVLSTVWPKRRTVNSSDELLGVRPLT